jgi:hypothetical protein
MFNAVTFCVNNALLRKYVYFFRWKSECVTLPQVTVNQRPLALLLCRGPHQELQVAATTFSSDKWIQQKMKTTTF